MEYRLMRFVIIIYRVITRWRFNGTFFRQSIFIIGISKIVRLLGFEYALRIGVPHYTLYNIVFRGARGQV